VNQRCTGWLIASAHLIHATPLSLQKTTATVTLHSRIFTFAEFDGITICAGIPRNFAARARGTVVTGECVRTAPSRGFIIKRKTALVAPRA